MPRPPLDTKIFLFLKAPRLGFVKTRLGKAIGSERALRTYRSLVERQLARINDTPKVEIHYTPKEAGDEIRAWLGEHQACHPQVEGNLGEKLTAAIQSAFQSGARSVICIGGDCPGLNDAQINIAVDKLNRGDDVVFGPTEDGGYYLVGLSAPQPKLFEAIAWSTGDTLSTSLGIAQKLGLKVSLLETLYDIDEVADLERAIAEGHLEN